MIAGPDPRAALRDAVARLLRASARDDLAAVVDRADLEVCASGETWLIGPRSVLAQRFALVVPPEVFAQLQRSEADRAALREAMAAVVRSFDTELLELQLFVRLDAGLASWGDAYRSAPSWAPEEPQPAAVQRAATRLARAHDQDRAAAILERASFEVAPIPEAGATLRRWVIRLPAADYAAVDGNPELACQLEAATRAAATSAATRVAEVALAVADSAPSR